MTKQYNEETVVDYKETSDLPPVETSSTYQVKHVLLWAALMFVCHSAPFFGIFFTSKGDDGKYEAWWSILFLFNGFTQFFAYLSTNPAKVVRHPNSFEFLNYFGKTIGEPGALNLYSAVAILPRNIGAIYRTDEHMHNMKESHKCFACCIGKRMTFCFKDLSEFASDHGLSVDNGESTQPIEGV